MGRPRIPQVTRDRIFELRREGFGARAIHRRLEAEPGAGAPAFDTVRKYVREFDRKPPEEQAIYDLARWPDTFLAGRLPWEAAPVVLELLRRARRVRIEVARWLWHVTLVAPAAPLSERVRCAFALARVPDLEKEPPAEDGHRRYSPAAQMQRAVEMYLAHQPWRGEEAERRYQLRREWEERVTGQPWPDLRELFVLSPRQVAELDGQAGTGERLEDGLSAAAEQRGQEMQETPRRSRKRPGKARRRAHRAGTEETP